MKFPCRVCGIHFPSDFENTFKTPCNFWGDMGFSNLEKELKVKFWDWLFSAPVDEIFIKTSIGTAITISTVPVDDRDKFENIYPGYEDLSEEERQELQKAHYKKTQQIKKYNTNKPKRLES